MGGERVEVGKRIRPPFVFVFALLILRVAVDAACGGQSTVPNLDTQHCNTVRVAPQEDPVLTTLLFA